MTVDNTSLPLADAIVATPGNSARAAPASHQHPRTYWNPSDQGLVTWTMDVTVATANSILPAQGTEASGHVSARITPETVTLHAKPGGTHTERLIHACWTIGHANGRMRGKATYSALRRWAHMLGFGGHFLTKARRYSVTFTDLRQARITYRRHQDTGPDYTPFKCQDDVDTETAIVITRLSYAGTGWHTFGDALLANTAADQARKRREAARDALIDSWTWESARRAA